MFVNNLWSLKQTFDELNPFMTHFLSVKISELFPLRLSARFSFVHFSFFSYLCASNLCFVDYTCFLQISLLPPQVCGVSDWMLCLSQRDHSQSDILFSAELHIDKRAFNITSGLDAPLFLK